VSGAGRRLTPFELRERIERGDDLQLVDVREPDEWAIGHLPGSILIPRGDLIARRDELDRERPVVCICHHGIRSAHAAAVLAAHGFRDVRDLAGGLERWAMDVDPEFPRYV
jgi:rhodanese-related sulfurtransferase